MEKLLGSDPPIYRESWHRLKGWYWAAVDCSLLPAQVTLNRITAERVELYSYVPPPGENIPVSVEPFPVDDLVPTEDEIKWAVIQLRNHCSGWTSGMREEYLKGWLAATSKNDKEEAAADQETPTEGTTAAPDGTGGFRVDQGEDAYGGFQLG